MDNDDDNLFGSDDEEVDDKKKETSQSNQQNDDADGDEEEMIDAAPAKKKNSDLFGSDDDEADEEAAEEENGEDGEDGRSRFSSKQQDLDDLFGGSGESMFESAPPIVKKPVTVSKLCIPNRNPLPEASSCMAIKMPNFVKIAPLCFDPAKLDVEEESRLMGMVLFIYSIAFILYLYYIYIK